MNVWLEYERRKKTLQAQLDRGEITHEQYRQKLDAICRELDI